MAKTKAKAMKYCSKCREKRPKLEFYKNRRNKDGLASWCKVCQGVYAKRWRKANSKKCVAYTMRWRKRNPEKVKELRKRWREKYPNEERGYIMEWRRKNPDRVRDMRRRWKEENWEHYLEWRRGYAKKRRRADPKLRLDGSIGTVIRRALRERKGGKRWETLVGYTLDDLITHLESFFKDGMSWGNYGSYWHVDHITPVCQFRYRTPEDEGFRKCWALDNLRPLEARGNQMKGGKGLKEYEQWLEDEKR